MKVLAWLFVTITFVSSLNLEKPNVVESKT